MTGKRTVRFKGLYDLGVLYSRTQVTRKEKERTFPLSFKLARYRNSPRVWYVDEIIEWVEARAATR